MADGVCHDSSVEVVRGSQRCFKADLVVVPDLAALHDQRVLCEKPDWAVCVLYILACGVDVTTAAAWQAAKGNPRNLRNFVVSHVSASGDKKSISISRTLAEQYPPLLQKAFKNICAMKGSKWTAATGAANQLKTMDEFIAWALPLRRVRCATGCKVQIADGQLLV